MRRFFKLHAWQDRFFRRGPCETAPFRIAGLQRMRHRRTPLQWTGRPQQSSTPAQKNTLDKIQVFIIWGFWNWRIYRSTAKMTNTRTQKQFTPAVLRCQIGFVALPQSTAAVRPAKNVLKNFRPRSE
jgi:hypothetical protein